MKKIIGLCAILAVSAIMFFGCAGEPPVLDAALVGSWISPSRSSTYSFADDASITVKSKSTSGIVVTTTTYEGSWETSAENTVVAIDYASSSKTDKTFIYEFISGIDKLAELAAADDIYSNPLRWAGEGDFTADDQLLLMIEKEEAGTANYWGIYKKL